ncbi:MAG: DUF4340 domain-containing protein [Eubacteriales bacterium]|nr:DUF4340 domain-containing protein [Eubacteriales bacterium]
MRPVRKKVPRAVGRRVILAVGSGILLFILVVMLLAYLRGKGTPDAHPVAASHDDHQITLIGKTPEDLAAFEVFPPGHASYRLIRVDSDYQLADDSNFPLNAYMVEQMAEDLTALDAEIVGELAEVPGGAEALGLGAGHLKVIADYTDGSSRTFLFGDAAYTDIPSDYLMLSEDNTVYTVSPQIRSNLDFPLGALRPLPRIDFNSDLLNALEVQDKDNTFRLDHEKGFWQTTQPIIYPADLGKMAELGRDIEAMRLAVYVGEAADLDLAAYGLAQPVCQVVFHLAESVIVTQTEDGQAASIQEVEAQSLRFAIGDDIGHIGFYCQYHGAVYQASYASMGFLTTLDLFDMLAKKPVVIPINRLSSLRVEDPSAQKEYQVELVERIEKNNALALDEEGRQIFDPVISVGGKETDRDAFIREYLKLMDLTARGRLPGDYVTANEPLKRFTLTAEGMRLDLAFHPYDALHLAMVVNGSAFWYVTRQAVAGIAL